MMQLKPHQLRHLRHLMPLFAIIITLMLSALLIAATGRDPLFITTTLIQRTTATPYGTGQIIYRATTLICTGLAVAIPYRLRLFNIGGEGQLQLAAFTAALVGATLPLATPPLIAITICTITALLTGSIWALIPALLRTNARINEVISTIMLNFIAQGITGYLLTRHFAMPSTLHTAPIIPAATLPTIDTLTGWNSHAPANIATIGAIALALITWHLLNHTRTGYEMRATGLQPQAANHAGINTNRHAVTAMLIGGAAAGLAAINIIAGYRHYYEEGITTGLGFGGIAVALIGGAHPLGLILAALFISLLEYGGLTINSYLPRELFMVIESIAILTIITSNALTRRLK